MTEAIDDAASSLVRVCAQVMMRDDSTGGWVPMWGGGLSSVSVCKRFIQSDQENCRYEYLIYGKKLSDQTVVLSCTIKKDFEYNKVMPTFHHWRTGDHKFGLTFQTAADARAFDKGIRDAVDQLLDGMKKIPWIYTRRIDAEDEVFMAVNLPVERDGSMSSSGSGTTCSISSRHTPTVASLPTPEHLPYHLTTVTPPMTTPDLPGWQQSHQLHHHHSGGSNIAVGIATSNTSPASTLSTPAWTPNQPLFTIPPFKNHFSRKNKPKLPPADGDRLDEKVIDKYSYIQLSKIQHAHPIMNEYSLPKVDAIKSDRRDSIASIKKQQQLEIVGATDREQLPGKRLKKKSHRGNRMNSKRRTCKHCHDFYWEDNNPRGACADSPDSVLRTIDKVSCISCAHGLMYHFMSDDDGQYSDPCSCNRADDPCVVKWLGMALLSLVVPCLWCYLPLRACHRCAVSCHLCGGRHEVGGGPAVECRYDVS